MTTNDGLRQPASPPHQVGKNTRMEGIRMEPRKGTGELQHRHVAGHRCGFEAGHACPAARILTHTAQEWGISMSKSNAAIAGKKESGSERF